MEAGRGGRGAGGRGSHWRRGGSGGDTGDDSGTGERRGRGRGGQYRSRGKRDHYRGRGRAHPGGGAADLFRRVSPSLWLCFNIRGLVAVVHYVGH